MAQDPLQIDSLQVKGDASVGSRLIEADATDGSLKFTDARIPGGLNLHQVPGLQQVDRVFLVGEGGLGLSKDSAGVAFTSIQDALDSLSDIYTDDNPATILVAPGTYTENLVVEKDGIQIIGLGRVTLRNSGVADTLTVIEGVGIPLGFKLQNVRVENTEAGRAAVLVDGGIGSTIGLGLLDIADCELVATGVGGFVLDVDTVNNVRVSNINCSGTNATSIIRSRQVASLELRNITMAPRLVVDYDTGGDIPSDPGSLNVVRNCTWLADATITLTGTGVWDSANSDYGDVTVGGDQSMTFRNDAMGDLVVNDTVAVERIDGSRGTLTGAVGSSVAERVLRGEASFVASSTEAVTFDAPMPDANYTVSLDPELVAASFDDIPHVDLPLATTGFTISFGVAQTTTVRWTVTRNL